MMKRLFLLIVLGSLSACSFIEGQFSDSSSAQGQGCGLTTVVQGGDTVYGIARRCKVSVRDLIEANDLTPPYTISAGMTLRIPGADVYVVQRGDTLLGVARKLKVEFRSFAQINGKTDPYPIFVGEKLKIPGKFGGSTQTAAKTTVKSGETRVVASPNQQKGGSGSFPATPSATASSHPAFQPQEVIPPEPSALSGKGFVWPVRGPVIQGFGPIAKGQSNDGINIAAKQGTPVTAAENGVVAYAGNELKGFGNLLLVKHADGWMTAYAHNEKLLVGRGETVKKGQKIATVGASGNVTRPQLHFELRRGTEAVDPQKYLK